MQWRRRKSFIDPKRQLWFAMELLVLFLGFVFLCAFFLFLPPFSQMFGPDFPTEALLEDLLTLLMVKWPLVCLSFGVFLLIGILVSHRLWGPLVAIDRVFTAWRTQGKRSKRITFRKYDYLVCAESMFNDFLDDQEQLLNHIDELAKEIHQEVVHGNLDKIEQKIIDIQDLLQTHEESHDGRN